MDASWVGTSGTYKPRVDAGANGLCDWWSITGKLTVPVAAGMKIAPQTQNYAGGALPPQFRRLILRASGGIVDTTGGAGMAAIISNTPSYRLFTGANGTEWSLVTPGLPHYELLTA